MKCKSIIYDIILCIWNVRILYVMVYCIYEMKKYYILYYIIFCIWSAKILYVIIYRIYEMKNIIHGNITYTWNEKILCVLI